MVPQKGTVSQAEMLFDLTIQGALRKQETKTTFDKSRGAPFPLLNSNQHR